MDKASASVAKHEKTSLLWDFGAASLTELVGGGRFETPKQTLWSLFLAGRKRPIGQLAPCCWKAVFILKEMLSCPA